MRLKNNIFLWAVPAAIIPLAILGFVATSWSERVYLREADRELSANLENVVVSIQRRMQIEQDLITGLAGVPALQGYLPVLEALAQGRPHDQATLRFERVNRFFETFQSVRTSLDTVRILDRQGHSLVKVSDGRRSPPVFDGFGSLPHVEDEPEDAAFSQALGELRGNEIGSLLLTGNLITNGIGDVMPVYNTVAPLVRGSDVVGYLTINPPLLPLNRLLSLTPSVHGSSLLVGETDTEMPDREGLVLFDPQRGIDLLNASTASPRLETSHPSLFSNAFAESQGIVTAGANGARIYYQTFLPYPDKLVAWVVALQVRPEVLSAPFRNIRLGIIFSVLLALLLSLVLTRAAARRIAGPALHLAQGLADFATGQRGQRVSPSGPDELQQAGRAFNDMAAVLERAESERDAATVAQYRSRRLASLGQMAAGIAHEINNPINTILSLTTLIDRDLPGDAEDTRNDIHSIREETQRIAETVRAILNFSHEIAAERACFDAAEWLRETVQLARREQRGGDVAIDLEIPGPCEIEGDRRLLQRVLLNLIENAAHASPPGKPVTISLGSEVDAVVIEVMDEGAGLTEEESDRAFDPFFTTKPEGVGSGLGLSISLGIVQYHGGSLALGNRPGGGAVARLVLPTGAECHSTESLGEKKGRE